MSYVYIVLYDETSVMIARKFERWNNIADEKILHYSGQDVFPGGRIERNELQINAAYREFLEETGINLTDATNIRTYQLVIPDDVTEFTTRNNFHYYALYVRSGALESLVDIINTNLSSNGRAGSIDGELEFVRTESRDFNNALNCFQNMIPVSQPCLHNASQVRDWFQEIVSQLPA